MSSTFNLDRNDPMGSNTSTSAGSRGPSGSNNSFSGGGTITRSNGTTAPLRNVIQERRQRAVFGRDPVASDPLISNTYMSNRPAPNTRMGAGSQGDSSNNPVSPANVRQNPNGPTAPQTYNMDAAERDIFGDRGAWTGSMSAAPGTARVAGPAHSDRGFNMVPSANLDNAAADSTWRSPNIPGGTQEQNTRLAWRLNKAEPNTGFNTGAAPQQNPSATVAPQQAPSATAAPTTPRLNQVPYYGDYQGGASSAGFTAKDMDITNRYIRKDSLPPGGTTDYTAPVNGMPGSFKTQVAPDGQAEYGRAIYSDSAYGATRQGLDKAIATQGEGYYSPQDYYGGRDVSGMSSEQFQGWKNAVNTPQNSGPQPTAASQQPYANAPNGQNYGSRPVAASQQPSTNTPDIQNRYGPTATNPVPPIYGAGYQFNPNVFQNLGDNTPQNPPPYMPNNWLRDAWEDV